jgi:hypothetical protein
MMAELDDKTGLITPDDLPDDLLDELTYTQIEKVGHFLFEQLVKQRDFTRKEKNT